MDDQQYTNRFEEVHSKVKVLNDQARGANERDAELRESRLKQEFKGVVDREPD